MVTETCRLPCPGGILDFDSVLSLLSPFVPDPLPEPFTLCPSTWACLSFLSLRLNLVNEIFQ